MKLLGVVLIAALCCCLAIAAPAPVGKKTLVVLEENSLRVSHSKFLGFLDENFDVTYQLADDEGLSISSYGEFLYDNVVLLTPSVEDFAGTLSSAEVLSFIDHGGNVLLAADSDLTRPLREIASGCGVTFDAEGTKALDHVNFDAADPHGDHSLILTREVLANARMTGAPLQSALLFHGVAHRLAKANGGLLIPVVTGEASAYSYKPGAKMVRQPHAIGKNTLLVSALQARNNARVIISGSLDMFSDKLINTAVSVDGKKAASANWQVATELTLWAFTGRGFLRASNIHHHRVGEKVQPHHYRIKDDIEYHVDVEEWDGATWRPFVADDLQLDIIRLDPHIRTALSPNGKGHFSVRMRLPDVYGMFTFRLHYHRMGVSHLESAQVVGVHPFRHDEYERWIVAAYPYYTSALSMLAGLFVFSFVFLWNRQPAAAAPAAKKAQ